MIIKPVSINGNLCRDFNSIEVENLSVLSGGYIITPNGEIILVKDTDQHQMIFSDYINAYLENKEYIKYNTLMATKILCELGCCVYAGIRLEYFKNKLEKMNESMASLTFPNNPNSITESQKIIIKKLLKSNKSLFGSSEKIPIQYGSFPDNIYNNEEIHSLLNNSNNNKCNQKQ